MDHLPRLVKGLTREQARFYKLHAARTAHGGDRKDFRLFDLLRKNGSDDSGLDKFYAKHYTPNSKNAFYRLRNRLLEDLNRALTTLYYDEDEYIHTLHMLALYRHFAAMNRQDEARYYLRRAELNASAIDHHELLDIIYGEYIRISHETLHINPEVYITKRKSNREQLEALRAIDDLLSVVTYRLKTAQNFAGETPVLELLRKTTDDYLRDRNLKSSPSLRFRIYQAVSQVLLQRREYPALETYLLRTWKEFGKDKIFDRNNHDTKLQMLTYIVNTLFKNKKYKLSLKWTDQLKSAMDEFNGMLYDKYMFFYYNALVINYSVIDRPKAIEILNHISTLPQISSNSYHQVFVHLNLSVLLFDEGNYKESVKNLTRLYVLDGYKSADDSLKLKITACDLIARYELDQADVLDYKLKRAKREFNALLKEESHYAERALFEILRKLMGVAKLKEEPVLLEKIRSFISWTGKNREDDSQIIDYERWLRNLLQKSRLNA
jgi:hypothetical protein